MRTVNHVGLTVTDLERSVAFYRDVVEFMQLDVTS
jgi:catechol 2,3-dioxygenase-like lactoylglutathione lyase family enzyme